MKLSFLTMLKQVLFIMFEHEGYYMKSYQWDKEAKSLTIKWEDN